MENEDIVSVILYDTAKFVIGERYRFCLVLVQTDRKQREMIIGCSNITKLKHIDNILVSDKLNNSAVMPVTITSVTSQDDDDDNGDDDDSIISDISSFEKITNLMENEHNTPEHTTIYRINKPIIISTTIKPIQTISIDNVYASQIMNHFNDSLMPSFSICILITCIFAFIWAATKITHHRRSIPSTVCYAATDQHSVDIENSNRYLKLQATTTL